MALKRDEIANLRAKDPIAAKIVEEWAAHAVLSGQHDDRAIEAQRFAQAMRAWRVKHFPERGSG